jgi:hypothetical protein
MVTQMADREVQRSDLWLTSLQGFASMCNDARSDVRRMALDALQSCILASRIKITFESSWKLCFERVLVPLLNNLVNIRYVMTFIRPSTSSPFDIKYNA